MITVYILENKGCSRYFWFPQSKKKY